MINRYILYLSGEPYIHWLLVAVVVLLAMILPGVSRRCYYLLKRILLSPFLRALGKLFSW